MPRATYRLQLHDGFGFAEVARLAPALARLGVSHVYLSPVLEAASGSTHGYDVVDPRVVRRSLGGEEGWRAMVAALRAHGLGIVVDIVPNHLALRVAENPLLWDVLRHGPASRWAGVFDFRWERAGDPARARVLLAVLDDHYGRVLDAGRIRLALDGGEVVVRVDDARFPVDPASLAAEGIDTQGTGVEADLAACNADAARLDRVLERQHHRLAHWRVARDELDHRRFFDVNELIGVRLDEPGVFDLVHERVLRFVTDGDVDGLRVDHVDGLRRPGAYLAELRARAPGTWIVVEKILEHGEPLAAWPVDGTTGYDALRDIQGVLTDPGGEAPLSELWHELTGEETDVRAVAAAAKRQVLRELLAPDLDRLVDACHEACRPARRWRDLTRAELHRACTEILVTFPVYRTYLGDDARDPWSRRIAAEAIARARAGAPDVDDLAFDAIERLLCGGTDADGTDADVTDADARATAVGRFEQLSGPVMAKGVEDTTFYRHLPFVAGNEVGCDPAVRSIDVAEFHRANEDACRRTPLRMVTTSTHDTKRSEDVRARLLVLAERPAWWAAQLQAWFALDERRGCTVDAPTRVLLLQTLVGAHPLSFDRAAAYLRKAVREAKRHTSWVAPDEAYEAAVLAHLESVLDDAEACASLDAFVASIEPMARANSLAQVLLRCTVPGVPDLYQGNEHLTYDLVDPDNRRPLDVGAMARQHPPSAPPDGPLDPAAKHWVTARALGVRAAHPDAFHGPAARYQPLSATGTHAAHALGYRRGDDVLVVVTRLSGAVRDGWAGTSVTLPDGSWHDVLAERTHRGCVPLDELLALLPVALLVRDAPEPRSA